ncbi:kinase-like protein [Ceratobasidium sp. AG-I]|nr:kinase-like protein [Ceratobasidium sp. AG-I]
MLQQAAHELHVWSKCTHPYVQELLGVARVREQIAMISRWLEHGDLPEYLQNYPTTDRCKMCTRVAEGLTYLHGRGIVSVHGDIKGGNILVADDHAPKLTDFGNATLQDYSLRFATTTTKRHISWRWTVGGPSCVPTPIFET